MLFVTIVGLYTSRIVLDTLGFENYGIYTLVGGIIVFFSFINNALLTSTQRSISYELGKENPNIKPIFSECFRLHAILSLIILLLAETIGLWVVNCFLNIPESKMAVANWVYQFSVFCAILSILRCPLNAVLIAYERMSLYAYIGVLETALKLVVAYCIVIIPNDKLFSYALLTFISTLIIFIINTIYTLKKIPEVRFVKSEAKHSKNILGFTKWTIFGSIANVCIEQGLNLLINFFYGITVNAAIGIANQVNTHISAFVNNFQVAFNPQLTKNEASKNRSRQYSLIFKSAKFSYFIMLFIAAPIILNLDYLLKIWLVNYPPETTNICIFIIIGVLIETLSGPLWVSIFATGKIKTYQIVISLILLLNIPVSLVLGKMGLPPYTIYAARASIYILAISCRLTFLRKLINLNIYEFIRKVIYPTLAVSAIIVTLIVLKYMYISNTTFTSFVIESLLLVFVEIVVIGAIGLNNNERKFIFNIIKSKLKI